MSSAKAGGQRGLTTSNFMRSHIESDVQDNFYSTNKSKMDESKFIRKESETYFFEVFNKHKKKCPILIPDTLFANGGTISSWYFTSKKHGAILKKKFDKLNAIEVFKTLYRESPIAQDSDFNDKEIIAYLKREDDSDQENDQTNKVQGGQSLSEREQHSLSLKKILKQMALRTQTSNFQDQDDNLPYIAYVRFFGQKPQCCKPYELYNLLQDRLGEVKMIQTYIFTRGQGYGELAQQQSGCFICEYSHLSNTSPSQFLTYKKQVSSELKATLHKEKIRSLNHVLNSKIEDKVKVIISFIESTIRIDIKKAYLKFIEDIQGEVFYAGMLYDLLYLPKRSDTDGKTASEFESEALFSGVKVKNDKNKWKSAEILPICYGEFCSHQFKDSHKFLSYRGKKQEFEKNFNLIPDKNKIFNNKFPFCVTALIIKKVQDNIDIADKILEKHKIYPKGDDMDYDINDEDDEDKQDIRRKSSAITNDGVIQVGSSNADFNKCKKPPKHLNKKLYPDNYASLYKAVPVCQPCFLIYSLLSDYFDELIKASTTPAQKHQQASDKKWVHSEKVQSQDEERAYQQKKQYSNGGGLVGSASQQVIQSSKKKSQLQGLNYHSETKKQHIHKTLSEIKIGNQRGPKLLKGGYLTIEGTSELPRIGVGSKTQYLNFNRTSNNGRSMPNTMLFQNQENAGFQKPTESVTMKEIPRVSYKIISKPKKGAPSQDQQEQGSLKFQRRGTIFMTGAETKILSMKHTLGMAMKNLIKQNQQIALKQQEIQQEDLEEKRRLINFFYEVSKDVEKYELKKRFSGATIQRANSITSRRSTIVEGNESQQQIGFLSPVKTRNTKDLEEEKQMIGDSSPNNLRVSKGNDHVETKRITAQSVDINKDNFEQRDTMKKNSVFKSTLQSGILKFAQKVILTMPKSNNPNLDKVKYLFAQRQQLSITTSLFHYQNLDHIKTVSFYRISTPKAPFYTEKGGADDRYIIPVENYKSMNIEQYAQLLKVQHEGLQDCGVFFIDEHTSMIYSVIENNIEAEINPQQDINESKFNEYSSQDEGITSIQSANITSQKTTRPNKKKVFQNYIVILDIFDSFVEKIELFDKIARESQQPVRFILFNLPGQPYTQYNRRKTVLNNAYYSSCIDLLLFHLHEKSLISCLFEPYNLIGVGNGANIALHFALLVNDTNDNLRSILVFNGFSYIDRMLRQSLEMAIDSFQKCPDDLTDYGDYFFKNMIYSTNNINLQQFQNSSNLKSGKDQFSAFNSSLSPGIKISHASKKIQIKDKVNLCKGVLANISIKEKLKYLKIPIVYVYSKKNCFIHLKHSDVIKKVTLQVSIQLTLIQSIDHNEIEDVSLQYQNHYQLSTAAQNSFNPLEQLISNNVARSVMIIEGAHEIFSENAPAIEKVLLDYCRIKPPNKYFMMTTLKQSLGLGIFKTQLTSAKNQQRDDNY